MRLLNRSSLVSSLAVVCAGAVVVVACAKPLLHDNSKTYTKHLSANTAEKGDGSNDPNTIPAPIVEQITHPDSAEGEKGPGVPDFWVRPGYKVTLVAKDLDNARFMVFDAKGTLYLSRPNEGDIIMLRPGANGEYKQSGTFVDGLSKPHGMQIVGNTLWFTSDSKVSHATINDGTKKATDVTNFLTDLPQGGHWWRSILVTDKYVYTSIGDEGNITDLTNSDREKIWRYDLDGSNKHLFVSGIRNTEKLLVRPGTSDIYGCDQGSDWFGGKLGDKQGNQPITDFYPPDEFNHYVDGHFYGHPFVVGDRIPRVEYQNRPDIEELAAKTIPPAWDFGPHWAADGWTFLTSQTKFPKDSMGDAIVALHGSWNRSIKAGYRIERVKFDNVLNIPNGREMLVGTLSAKDDVLARPVDVTAAPDGSLFFSDDQKNCIYRLQYTGK